MTENFITEIFVEKSRNIKKFKIPISDFTRQHLIITGKNGSGKTSLLLEINKFLSKISQGSLINLESYKKRLEKLKIDQNKEGISDADRIQTKKNIELYQNEINSYGSVELKFSGSESIISEKSEIGTFILAYFDSKRHTQLNVPQGINKIVLNKKYNLKEKANVNFIQYIVNLKADRSFAKDDNDLETTRNIDNWFEKLEHRFRSIFDNESLTLKFNRKTYNFDILLDDKELFTFNTLSDGYSAIISIVTEILLRMEAHNTKSYDLEGVVIIDEIETHLHVDLQKKILPFLTDFFPKIQFIITTHSPFVLSSLSNATICDLESKIITTDLSGYSYDALIESYFKSDKYSEELKGKISVFEELLKIENPNQEQVTEIRKMKDYLSSLPKYLSKELHSKLLDIEINYLTKIKF
ncbi:MAG: AAA family ATPase [Chryseobacterium sp.]|uniref:AAA family ATPase n=1 Tax=Chryseobacterium sp. TaxID=1871047 RepID=UPI001B008444|nr:AAA family ATPase [Chryseobacterium sp.]MBO6185813.1 AAA family ATPase [Chryseobacterium sp.]